jgi:hypothetical protein
MRRTWRDVARPLIAAVIKEMKGKPLAEIRKALRAAYPFGERRHFPYKVWCSEVRRQLCLDVRDQMDLFDGIDAGEPAKRPNEVDPT